MNTSLPPFKALMFAAASLASSTFLSTPALAGAPTTADAQPVVSHYAEIGFAVFSDALTGAKQLQSAIDQLLAKPTDANLKAARDAWISARVPYMQTEVFRFGNKVVDDWEGQLNAWPLDEGLIDYVDANYQHALGNPGATANIIANKQLKVGEETLDLSTLTPELLAKLNELGGSEANVATGYHAIEFLLWGQDLNGTGPGAGNRPVTDFAADTKCTHGNCDRRRAYLKVVTQLLVQDLNDMVEQWKPGSKTNYRATLLAEPTDQSLRKMFYGMGSLALGELAGERLKVALEANSTEDEHDCFSDNTHNSQFYDAKGIRNIYFGEYKRRDGSLLKGPSLSALVAKNDPKADQSLAEKFADTEKKLQKIVDSANQGQHFDQLIAANNVAGNQLVKDAISALVAETGAIEAAAKVVGISELNADTADHTF